MDFEMTQQPSSNFSGQVMRYFSKQLHCHVRLAKRSSWSRRRVQDLMGIRDPVSGYRGGDFGVQFSVAIWTGGIERELQRLVALGEAQDGQQASE